MKKVSKINTITLNFLLKNSCYLSYNIVHYLKQSLPLITSEDVWLSLNFMTRQKTFKTLGQPCSQVRVLDQTRLIHEPKDDQEDVTKLGSYLFEMCRVESANQQQMFTNIFYHEFGDESERRVR